MPQMWTFSYPGLPSLRFVISAHDRGWLVEGPRDRSRLSATKTGFHAPAIRGVEHARLVLGARRYKYKPTTNAQYNDVQAPW